MIVINTSSLCARGRPKNFLTEEHVAQIARLYHEWRAEPGLSAVIATADAARNDFNLSPTRYVASTDQQEVLPLDEAIVMLQEAEEERAVADRELDEVLRLLGVGGLRSV